MEQMQIHQIVRSLRYKDPLSPTVEEMSLRQRFLSKFSNQEANILSYQDNPNCKCSGELMKAIANSVEDKNELLSYIIGRPVEVAKPNDMSGKMIVINDTETSWSELASSFKLKMMMFRGLTIVPSVDIDGRKILRVFFY